MSPITHNTYTSSNKIDADIRMVICPYCRSQQYVEFVLGEFHGCCANAKCGRPFHAFLYTAKRKPVSIGDRRREQLEKKQLSLIDRWVQNNLRVNNFKLYVVTAKGTEIPDLKLLNIKQNLDELILAGHQICIISKNNSPQNKPKYLINYGSDKQPFENPAFIIFKNTSFFHFLDLFLALWKPVLILILLINVIICFCLLSSPDSSDNSPGPAVNESKDAQFSSSAESSDIQAPSVSLGPWEPCDKSYLSNLHVGNLAAVKKYPNVPNRVRSEPDKSADILGKIQPGEVIDIVDGPMCANNWVWWYIRSQWTGLEGWTSEGDQDEYWLERIVATQTPTPKTTKMPTMTPRPTDTRWPTATNSE